LSKNIAKTLVLSILILCNLILVPNHAAGNASGIDNQKIDDLNAPIVRTAARGNEWFVSDEPGEDWDCSRTNPGPLQDCVETKAQSGDTVYVHEGHYHTDDPDDNLLLIQKSLHLIGSCNWSDTGPISCTPQNSFTQTNSSDLNGEDERRVIAITGPDISVTIENFIIHQGNADGKQPKPLSVLGAGGGIYASDLDSFVLKNNYIWSNKASDSGMSTDRSLGGGVYVDHVRKLDIHDNIIIFNSASARTSRGYGGGMYVYSCGDGGKVNIVTNRFHGNMVADTTTYSSGAGAYLLHVNNLSLDDNIFEYHNAILQDLIDGSALVLSGDVTANSIDHNLFYKNYGNTIAEFLGLTGDFTRNTFWDNIASYDLWIEHENDIEIINNFFGKTYGRALASSNEPGGTRGGISTIIYISTGCGNPVVDILNNTFALAEYGVQVDKYAYVDIKRNIFTMHTHKAIDVISTIDPNVFVDENLFWENADNGEVGSTYWEADPKLVDLWNGDFHLQTGSAAIDKVSGGLVHRDIDNEYRPMGFGFDLGADEFEDDIFTYLPIFMH